MLLVPLSLPSSGTLSDTHMPQPPCQSKQPKRSVYVNVSSMCGSVCAPVFRMFWCVCVCVDCPGMLPVSQSLITTVCVEVCVRVIVHKGGPASMTGVTKATPELVPDAEHHISTERCTNTHTHVQAPTHLYIKGQETFGLPSGLVFLVTGQTAILIPPLS